MNKINKGKMVTSLEFNVSGLMDNLFRIYHANSCTAPKWHAQPQKNLPNINVVKNAIITRMAPAFIIPSLRNE